jgi:ATP-dependent helicase/nuclease subunit B
VVAALRENKLVRAHFVLGPAGSGKTFRCLAEIRALLAKSPEGPPLVLVAPKQATFQIERQLLAEASLPGYTRLQILSFERLAQYVLAALHWPPPRLLSEEGRVMVLRALLERHQDRLRLFRASARLPGFARQLSALLREFQHYHLSPARIGTLTVELAAGSPLADKLHDFGLLLRAYHAWLRAEALQDADHLLDVAAGALDATHAKPALSTGKAQRDDGGRSPHQPFLTRPAPALAHPMGAGRAEGQPAFRLAGLWLDGFAEMTPQELDLLAAMMPVSQTATLAFCLEQAVEASEPPLSAWATVGHTFRSCLERLKAAPGVDVSVEVLARQSEHGRFAGNPALQHLEKHWMDPRPLPAAVQVSAPAQPAGMAAAPRGADCAGADESASCRKPLRVVVCANPEAEATFAAREILQFVREDGGRFRDVAVLLRSLDGYHEVLRRVFTRYEIPFFLDRREPVTHHPLAELTRSAVRMAAFGWRREDWFGALKTGLVHREEAEIDWLENEALSRGWDGHFWCQPASAIGDEAVSQRWERLRPELVPPFQRFVVRLAGHEGRPTGTQLAEAIAGLWDALELAKQLGDWSARSIADPRAGASDAVHVTVWQQMQDWLANLARAFPSEPLPLFEWLSILEAGLAGLTVGAIPPVLDQVLIGTIDRSRNPSLQMALVLGTNESVFPAAPEPDNLLTESDRERLAEQKVLLGPLRRWWLGRERYYGYMVCTRAHERLLLTFSQRDADDNPLNPSPFIARLRRLFPRLDVESPAGRRPWRQSAHAGELIAPWLAGDLPDRDAAGILTALEALPGWNELRDRLTQFSEWCEIGSLDAGLAGQLYGAKLETSVSRLEQFAACPFKFFVHSGLRAGERRRFELDAREQGSFQHEVLAEFHRQVRAEGKEWRELTPGAARERIGRIAAVVAPTFHEGLLRTEAASQFAARSLTRALQDWMETVIDWMRQYGFDPRAVEVGFGGADDLLPAWEIDLGGEHRLALRGKIDRVDLAAGNAAGEALCVVIDYKSSTRRLDPALLAGGVQLQLPAYLGVLRRLRDPQPAFGVARLVPAGVFYANVRGQCPAGATRVEVLANVDAARQKACQHTGRFDFAVLRQLDQRPGAKTGAQFNYRLKKDGTPYENSRDVMTSKQFAGFLDDVEAQLVRLGRAILSGDVAVDPYRRGRQKACDQCDYLVVCRIDPWAHNYRVLSAPAPAKGEQE